MKLRWEIRGNRWEIKMKERGNDGEARKGRRNEQRKGLIETREKDKGIREMGRRKNKIMEK